MVVFSQDLSWGFFFYFFFAKMISNDALKNVQQTLFVSKVSKKVYAFPLQICGTWEHGTKNIIAKMKGTCGP